MEKKLFGDGHLSLSPQQKQRLLARVCSSPKPYHTTSLLRFRLRQSVHLPSRSRSLSPAQPSSDSSGSSLQAARGLEPVSWRGWVPGGRPAHHERIPGGGGPPGEERDGAVAWETTEAEATAKFQLPAGRKREMGKSVEFVLPGDSEGADTSYQHHLTKEQHSSEVLTRGRKRALKDALAEQPEKKLTHRIRQKRSKDVKTLLEKPDHEIDRMKLSVMHLRLFQEDRERLQNRTSPSGPSSSNQRSSQFGDTDDFDPFGENYDTDRTDNLMLEDETKLNYHSYMNKQTRARWSKSDTDLFYQGLQQFGTDLAMINQLFPDKSCDQVRQKFKTEEKKHPMQVHDMILHRSRDNLYLKQVIKRLNIEDLQRDISSTHKQGAPPNEGDTRNENALHDFINDEENGSNCSDKELSTHRSEVKGEKIYAKSDDDLDVFDWY